MRHLQATGLTIALILCGVSPAGAANRWIEDTLSMNLGQVLSDDFRDRLYVADVGANQIIVIDATTEAVEARIAVPPPGLFDLSLSKDGRYLLAATGWAIVRVDRELLIAETFPLPSGFPGPLLNLAVDASGNVIGLGFRTQAYVIDLEAGNILSEFGWGQHSFDFPVGMIETDVTGDTLWIVSSGLNPSAVFKFDVSDPYHPVDLGRSDFSVGSFARDFVPSPTRDEVYIAPGHPYGIQVFDTMGLTVVDQMVPDVFIGGPPAVALDRAGESVFFPVSSVYTPDRVFHYRVADRRPLTEYPLEVRGHNARTRRAGLALDRRGRKLFVAYGTDTQFSPRSQVQVVDVGLRVDLDIRPGSPRNVVNPGSRGVLPVAVLSSPDLDATRIDPATLTFGPGDAGVDGAQVRFQDVNRDHRLDLVVAFRIDDTGIGCDDEDAVIHGMTPDGIPIYGSDALTPSGCR